MTPTTSLFIQYVSKFWGALVLRIVSLVNDKKTAQTYLFKEMTSPRYSPDFKWTTLNSNGTIVAADLVALDSSLPLKKRDSIGKVTGDIPKLGMKMRMSESLMTQIAIMRGQNMAETEIAKIIFEDSNKCLFGVYEQQEKIFLEALSTGVAVIDDDQNVGIGVRLDYGHPDANKFGVAFVWSDATTSTPIDDINNVLEMASLKGDSPRIMLMDRDTFNKFVKSEQVRGAWAGNMGFTGANMPIISLRQANDLLSDRFDGMQIRIVERTILLERDGVRTPYRPWAANKVTFISDMNVGSVVWSTLAETLNQNKAISYQVVDSYILMKKWHENEPFAELTSSQAAAVPVLDNVASMYIMDVSETQPTTGQTEGNTTITIYGDPTILVADLVAALVDLGINVSTSNTDVELISEVNKLSDEDEALLKTALGI